MRTELQHLDRIFLKNLMVRGIVGLNDEERKNRQDILVNCTFWFDTRTAARTDGIGDTMNYRTCAKAMIAHIENGAPLLVERLATELLILCFATDERIAAIEMTVEKPGAIRFAESVGLTIFRMRDELV